MNIQRTLIRITRDTKTDDDGCAETHEQIEVIAISNSSEQKAAGSKFATKEKKSARRQRGKTRKNVKLKKFGQLIKNFWRWCSINTNVLVFILLVVVLYLNPDIKEFLVDEKMIQLIRLVLGR